MILEDTLTHLSPEEQKRPEKQVIFLTGAAGYVGATLAHIWSQRQDVSLIIALDKEPKPELLHGNPKIHYIQGNTVDNFWEEKVRDLQPTIVVHAAWQIRSFYGKEGNLKQWRWNVVGSQHVFEYAFEMPSVRRLIYFSTVAPYGAMSSNTLEHFFTEHEPFRKTNYAYAEEKRVVVDVLKEELTYARTDGSKVSVYVVRPVAITGPRGRKERIRFGLQSVLSGDLKRVSFSGRLISLLVTWMPATSKWARQYVHEDDVADITTILALDSNETNSFEVFNLCPPGPFVTARDMAKAVGKKFFYVAPWMVRLAFFLFWHLSFGKIPTSPGGWKSYSYPVLVDGSKITRAYGYHYKYQSLEAFSNLSGRYETFIKNIKNLKTMPRGKRQKFS